MRIKLSDRLAALDKLARHLKLFSEPPPGDTQVIVPVQIVITDRVAENL